MSTKFVVYEILDEAGKLMYLGSSSRFEARKAAHKSTRNDGSKRAKWLSRYLAAGYEPQFKILCYCEGRADMLYTERAMITILRPPLNSIHRAQLAILKTRIARFCASFWRRWTARAWLASQRNTR